MGGWSVDPDYPFSLINGYDICNINATLSGGTLVKTCKLVFTQYTPSNDEIVAWLNANYPAYGPWTDSGGNILPASGADISGATINIPDVSFNKVCSYFYKMTFFQVVDGSPVQVTNPTAITNIYNFLLGNYPGYTWSEENIGASNEYVRSVLNPTGPPQFGPTLSSPFNIGGVNYTFTYTQIVNTCTLTINSNSMPVSYMLSYLQQNYPGITWSDNGDGSFNASTDISGISFNLPAGNNYTIVCKCRLQFPSNFSEPTSMIAEYLGITYAGSGNFGVGSDGNITGTGVQGFSATIPGVTYHIITIHSNCRLAVSSYTPTQSDIIGFLNQFYSQYGTWSADTSHSGCLTAQGDISQSDINIPGATVSKNCITTPGSPFNIYAGSVNLNSIPDTGLSAGDCITLSFSNGTNTYVSNCFSYNPDTCFTSLIRYQCNENAFGFYYTDMNGASLNYYNQVRLPFFLNKVQTKTKTAAYRKSTGEYIKLSAVLQQEYEVEVGWMTDGWHTCLAVALEHDTFQVWNENTSYWDTYMLDEGDYQVDWKNEPGINLSTAPAKFRLKAMPFNYVNSNCL